MNLTVKDLEELIKKSNDNGNIYVKIIKYGKEEMFNVVNSSPNPIKLTLTIEKDSEKIMKIAELFDLINNYGDMATIELIQTQSSIFITEIYDVNEGYLVGKDLYLLVYK
ncbi:MAG: hypothetical protein KGD63_12310 [Candidatus Lokiarchaeota archaeon]|nr:hypothetical protein [Candidatus Lokiarchaeota archaeon]